MVLCDAKATRHDVCVGGVCVVMMICRRHNKSTAKCVCGYGLTQRSVQVFACLSLCVFFLVWTSYVDTPQDVSTLPGYEFALSRLHCCLSQAAFAACA